MIEILRHLLEKTYIKLFLVSILLFLLALLLSRPSELFIKYRTEIDGYKYLSKKDIAKEVKKIKFGPTKGYQDYKGWETIGKFGIGYPVVKNISHNGQYMVCIISSDETTCNEVEGNYQIVTGNPCTCMLATNK